MADGPRERARLVRPSYTDGPLVKVARARHQAEAEMIENLLLEQGIPALSRRSGGFDVPDFLASGPRDILVPASGAEAAAEVLGSEEPPAAPRAEPGPPAWVRALAVALAVLILAVIAAGVLTAITS
jgi:Putative prokaryotic signal transducing protein